MAAQAAAQQEALEMQQAQAQMQQMQQMQQQMQMQQAMEQQQQAAQAALAAQQQAAAVAAAQQQQAAVSDAPATIQAGIAMQNFAQVVCQANCTSCGALLQFNMPAKPATIECYNCRALMVVQPQNPASASASGAVNSQMDKKIRKQKGPPRQPTAYNVFMKAELAKLKAEQPELHHREAFKIAAAGWTDSPQNPKNVSGGSIEAAVGDAPLAVEGGEDVGGPAEGEAAAIADSMLAGAAEPTEPAEMPVAEAAPEAAAEAAV